MLSKNYKAHILQGEHGIRADVFQEIVELNASCSTTCRASTLSFLCFRADAAEPSFKRFVHGGAVASRGGSCLGGRITRTPTPVEAKISGVCTCGVGEYSLDPFRRIDIVNPFLNIPAHVTDREAVLILPAHRLGFL